MRGAARVLLLALPILGIGLASVAPAYAWYDRWGYWHPDYRPYYPAPYYPYPPRPLPYRPPPVYAPPPVYVPPPPVYVPPAPQPYYGPMPVPTY